MRAFSPLSCLLLVTFAGLGACGSPSGGGSAGTSSSGGGGSASSGGAASSGSGGGGSSGSAGGSGGGASGGGSSSGGADGGSSGGGSSAGGSSGSGSGAAGDGGAPACTTSTAPITGTVGADGGSISRLVFAVAGDTRPVNEDDPSSYPTAIITKIFQDIEAQTPRPPLVLGTGDYQFSSTGSNATSQEQVSIYMQTRASYSGAFFPAMGNHECGVSGSFTTSDNNNCGPGNAGGATPNYNEFMSQMLGPIGKTTPYYAIHVNATDGSWTAKFVVTAANAWDTAQQTWLQQTMAQKTTYTFLVRHESSTATPPLPPGVAGVDAVVSSLPYTLMIVGHAHTYGHFSSAPREVIFGNGGAPLSSKDYGYGLFSQRCDGAIVVDAYDYQTGATDPKFHFVVTPAGAITN